MRKIQENLRKIRENPSPRSPQAMLPNHKVALHVAQATIVHSAKGAQIALRDRLLTPRQGSTQRKIRKNKENTVFLSFSQVFLGFSQVFLSFSLDFYKGRISKHPPQIALTPPQILPLWISSVSTPESDIYSLLAPYIQKRKNSITTSTPTYP